MPRSVSPRALHASLKRPDLSLNKRLLRSRESSLTTAPLHTACSLRRWTWWCQRWSLSRPITRTPTACKTKPITALQTNSPRFLHMPWRFPWLKKSRALKCTRLRRHTFPWNGFRRGTPTARWRILRLLTAAFFLLTITKRELNTLNTQWRGTIVIACWRCQAFRASRRASPRQLALAWASSTSTRTSAS